MPEGSILPEGSRDVEIRVLHCPDGEDWVRQRRPAIWYRGPKKGRNLGDGCREVEISRDKVVQDI